MKDDIDDSVWRQIEPYLDAAMASLHQLDRDAIVLRYFENRSLKKSVRPSAPL